MTEATIQALIIGIPVFLTALGGLIVSVHTALKATEIRTATNGTLSALKTHNEVQEEKMAGLEKHIAMLAEDKKAAAEIAKELALKVEIPVTVIRTDADDQKV